MEQDPSQIEVPNVVGKTLRGAVVFAFRQILCQGLGAVTGIVLARNLLPAEYGLYAICGFWFYFLHSLSDLGLGASVVRQSENPSENSLRLIQFVRHAVDSTAFAAVWVFAPRLAAAYDMPPSYAMIFRAIAGASLVLSFMVVPNVLLERQLEFGKLALIEIGQQIARAAVVLGFVFSGFGIYSFPASYWAFAFTGVFLANLFHWWRPKWRFDASEVRSRLAFGLPYQASACLNFMRDGVTPLLVGVLLGQTEVGFLNWAEMFAMFSVLPVVALQRVFMPGFAQLHSDRKQLSPFVQQSLTAAHALAAPFAMLSCVLAYPTTNVLFGAQWTAALPLFFGLWCVNLFAPTVNPLVSLLNAAGHSKQVFWYLLAGGLELWLLSFVLLKRFGPGGYVAALLLVQLNVLALYLLARKSADFNPLRAMLPGWCSAATMGAVVYSLNLLWPIQNFAQLFAVCAAGGLVYVSMLYVFFRSETGIDVILRRPRALVVARVPQ